MNQTISIQRSKAATLASRLFAKINDLRGINVIERFVVSENDIKQSRMDAFLQIAGISTTEATSVLSKFEFEPSVLTADERSSRLKFLTFIKNSLVAARKDPVTTNYLKASLGDNSDATGQMGLRMIDLLIYECTNPAYNTSGVNTSTPSISTSFVTTKAVDPLLSTPSLMPQPTVSTSPTAVTTTTSTTPTASPFRTTTPSMFKDAVPSSNKLITWINDHRIQLFIGTVVLYVFYYQNPSMRKR